MALGTNIDLDRVIFDPEYRRNVIDELNRGEDSNDVPRFRSFEALHAPAAETAAYANAQ